MSFPHFDDLVHHDEICESLASGWDQKVNKNQSADVKTQSMNFE
jgi:hypothetical protein